MNNNLFLLPVNPNNENNIPYQMSYDEAESALAAEPKLYEVRLNGKRVSLLTLYNMMGNIPNTITNIFVRHPDHWEALFGGGQGGLWYLHRTHPLNKYGVLTRTHGTIHTSEEGIWEWLTELFPNIEQEVQRQQVAQKKLANLRTKALLETSKQAGLPEDLENYLLPSYFEHYPRPTGYGEILNNMRKINTTLFSKGGKRKGKKSKTRKYKKRF
jgi:hypothetical protein